MLIETNGAVTLIAATSETLDAEDIGDAALAAALGLAEPLAWPPPFNGSETRAWMRRLIAAEADRPGYGSWYVIADGRPVGIAGFKGPPDDLGDVEIGYSILEPEQRRGYGTAAARLLVARAFREPAVRSVSAETLPELTASQTVMQRCGMTLVSTWSDTEHGEILRFTVRR